jgi:general secretion pathway protein N
MRKTVSNHPSPRAFRWGLAGALLGGLGALVLFAPAAWVASALQKASKQQIVLSDPRGTVWNGSAQLVLTGGADSRDATALPERVQWTLRPSISGAHAQVLATCCSAKPMLVAFSPRWGGAQVQIQALVLSLPAQLLAGLGTPWNTLAPQGRLQIQSDTLSIEWLEGRTTLKGSATLEMNDMSSRLSTLRPLGDYRLTLSGGSLPSLQLQTLQGALQLSGSGQWVGSRLRFSGEASAAPDREAALSNLLNIIGRRQGLRSVITLG